MTDSNHLIFYGVILLVLGIAAGIYDTKHKTHSLVNIFLYGSWITAAAFALYIFSILNINDGKEAIALSPLGMMIAALIASASIMKNIAETKAHDIKKSEKEKDRKRIYTLNAMNTIYHTIRIFTKDKFALGTNYDAIDKDIKQNVKIVRKLIDSVFSDNVLPYLAEKDQESISYIYRKFYYFIALHINSSNTLSLPNEPKPPKNYENVIFEYEDIKVEINKYINLHKNIDSKKE